MQDLRGSVWACHDTVIYAGYHLLRLSLLQCGFPTNYFRWAVTTGSPLQPLQAIRSGDTDATAIDPHILAVRRQQGPESGAVFRIIDEFGPSQAPLIVVSSALEPGLRQKITERLFSLYHDPEAAQRLQERLIACFAPLTEKDARASIHEAFARE